MTSYGYDGDGEMSCTEMFRYLVDKMYEALEKNVIDGRTIIKKDGFDRDVPEVDEVASKVVFYTSNAMFGDSYGGLVFCLSTEGFSEEKSGKVMSVSLVSLADMKNPRADYKVLLDDIYVDRQSLEMMAALLQYISVMALLQRR